MSRGGWSLEKAVATVDRAMTAAILGMVPGTAGVAELRKTLRFLQAMALLETQRQPTLTINGCLQGMDSLCDPASRGAACIQQDDESRVQLTGLSKEQLDALDALYTKPVFVCVLGGGGKSRPSFSEGVSAQGGVR